MPAPSPLTRHELVRTLPASAHVPGCDALDAPTLLDAQRCLGCAARYSLAHQDPTARGWYISARVHARVVRFHEDLEPEPPPYQVWVREAEEAWDAGAPAGAGA